MDGTWEYGKNETAKDLKKPRNKRKIYVGIAPENEKKVLKHKDFQIKRKNTHTKKTKDWEVTSERQE